jgi:hypothetical protein
MSTIPHARPNYVVVWAWLVFLLGISPAAVYLPFSQTVTVTLIFVVAAVKAFLVVVNFMSTNLCSVHLSCFAAQRQPESAGELAGRDRRLGNDLPRRARRGVDSAGAIRTHVDLQLYGATFYTLIGFHGLHVLAAVIVLLVFMANNQIQRNKLMKRFLQLLGIAVFLLFLLPAVSEACPKCFAATGKQALNAYYVSIAFMSLIPFGIIGAVLTWIYRQTHPRRMDKKTN